MRLSSSPRCVAVSVPTPLSATTSPSSENAASSASVSSELPPSAKAWNDRWSARQSVRLNSTRMPLASTHSVVSSAATAAHGAASGAVPGAAAAAALEPSARSRTTASPGSPRP